MRKGALSPGASRGEGSGVGQGSAIQSALRSINFRRSQRPSKDESAAAAGAGANTPVVPQGQGGRFPSILQELESDTPRKGSWTTSEGREQASSVSDNRT